MVEGVLKDALLAAADTEGVSRKVTTPYGMKYEVRFELFGPHGPKSALWRFGSFPRAATGHGWRRAMWSSSCCRSTM